MHESRTPAAVTAPYAGGVPVGRRYPGDSYVDRLRRQRDMAWDEVARLRRELAQVRVQAQAHWYAAHHDELTGLPNRRALRDHAARLLLADTGWVACAIIDLDGFKTVNDRYGHPAGDAVLVEVGRRLAGHANAGSGRFAARLGGDEFAVVLTGIGHPGPHLAAAASALAALFAPALALPDGQTLAATASIGVAATGTRTTPLTALLRRADAAMYQAKHHPGRRTGCAVHLATGTAGPTRHSRTGALPPQPH